MNSNDPVAYAECEGCWCNDNSTFMMDSEIRHSARLGVVDPDIISFTTFVHNAYVHKHMLT